MMHIRHSRRIRSLKIVAAAVMLILGVEMLPRAVACLTSNIDKRTVQWSTAIVQAKLTSLGTKLDIPAPISSAMGGNSDHVSGRPAATAYRNVSFEVTDSVDGSLQPGQTVKVLGLIGGRPGDGTCPTLMPESVGKKFILMLRPFEQTRIDLPNGTPISIAPGTMVIVSQLGEEDMNSDTLPDLKKLVTETRDASAGVTGDTIAAQIEAVAAAHDGTEAEQAEKTLEDIGVAALPAMQDRIKSADGVGKTRLRRIIADVTPPMLSAEPE